jgi:DNA-binding transcriptional regulator YhcF (GntR family)
LKVDYDSIKPIYLQIAEAIEDDILMGRLPEGAPVYSQQVLSKELKVNPATAAKGINLLVSEGTLEKHRGLSMTVARGAKTRLISSRQKDGLNMLVQQLVAEARKIELPQEEVVALVRSCFVTSVNGGRGGNHE